MILGRGHNFTLDYYTLGAMLFEMLTGLPPFFMSYVEHMDWQQQFKEILSKELSFPAYVSPDAASLISQLLDRDPAMRIGAQRGATEIMEHPWCRDIDWEQIEARSAVPPYVPSLEEIHFYAKGKGSMSPQKPGEPKYKIAVNEYVTEHVVVPSLNSEPSRSHLPDSPHTGIRPPTALSNSSGGC